MKDFYIYRFRQLKVTKFILRLKSHIVQFKTPQFCIKVQNVLLNI